MRWLQKPLPAAFILVTAWTIFRLAVLWHTGIPQPREHDEFSYILGADTFAHGRLANPTPALPQFFESPHILMHPTYASKYPPGQAMFLALGQVLFGAPFYGVLIGNALMLFTFCLMLFAWVPPRWALAVSAMFALILSPWMYWTDSYWGGSVAASGGALVLLAMGMCRRKQTPLAGVVFALGVLLLFWTRPYEGGVFTLAVLAVFAGELWRNRRASMFAAALVVVAVGGAWTCYDNQAVTGHPFLLPYVLHSRQYDVVPVFWFQPLRPEPKYDNPRLAALHGINGWEGRKYEIKRPRWEMPAAGLRGTWRTVKYSIGPVVLVTLLLPAVWRDPLYRKMAIVTSVVVLALAAETFHGEHYSAPVWAALALMIAVWSERAWSLRFRGIPAGAALVLLAFIWSPIAPIFPEVSEVSRESSVISRNRIWAALFPTSWADERANLIRRLTALGGPQLVIVRYPSLGWRVREEWVYNGADLDHERVIFAHDRGAEQDRALLDYYSNRTAWLLTFDPVSGQENVEPFPRESSHE